MTGFFRAQRGIESEVEDSFTIILQYDGLQRDLLVTVKTSVTTPMEQQFKYLFRGTEGSYLKVCFKRRAVSYSTNHSQFQERSTCPQEEQIDQGLNPTDTGFGVESESVHGILNTIDQFDEKFQMFHEPSKKYTGKVPTVPGRWAAIYENLFHAINGDEELEVKATQSRDAIRVIELARESHEKGSTVPWS